MFERTVTQHILIWFIFNNYIFLTKLKIPSNQRWWPRSIYFQFCSPRVITITRNKPRGGKLKIYRPVFCMEPPLVAGEELQRLTMSWRLRMAFEQKGIFIELCHEALVLELLTPTTPPRTHAKVAKCMTDIFLLVRFNERSSRFKQKPDALWIHITAVDLFISANL